MAPPRTFDFLRVGDPRAFGHRPTRRLLAMNARHRPRRVSSASFFADRWAASADASLAVFDRSAREIAPSNAGRNISKSTRAFGRPDRRPWPTGSPIAERHQKTRRPIDHVNAPLETSSSESMCG
jgi:hypothetical protein